MRFRIAMALVASAVIAGSFGTGVTHTTDPNDCAGLITVYATPGATFYTDDHGTTQPVPGPPGLEEFWIYMESNGHAGLQKGGFNAASPIVGEDVIETIGGYDACNTAHNGSGNDTILF